MHYNCTTKPTSAHQTHHFPTQKNKTRWRVLKLYKRANGKNTLVFIDIMIEELLLPIQRLQTDRGREFFAVKVQEKLMAYGIKFRPNKPGVPHLKAD